MRIFCRIVIFIFLLNLTNVIFVNASVVINEIMYKPDQCSQTYCEWLEIYNTDAEDVNLTGWTLCNKELLAGYINRTNNNTYSESGMTINGNSFAVITDGGSGTDVYDNFNVNSSSLALHTGASTICGGLSDLGKTIYLNDSTGASVDSVTYSNSWGANGDNKTLERIDPTQNNWSSSANANGTPGAQNSVYADITPPIIANLTNTSITNESAAITWVTDDSSNSTVYYGTSASLRLIKINTALVKMHSINLTNLKNNTVYYYNASSCNEYGYCNISLQYNFTTLQNTINQAPNITSFYPSELSISVKEPNNQTFNITYNDAENDAINISWYLNSSLKLSGIDKYEWNFSGNYSSSGFYNVTVIISDNSLTAEQNWSLTVNNTDNPPLIIINNTKYSGNTTNFSSLNSTELQNITNMTLENVNNGKIIFIDNINLSYDINLSSYMDISYNKIEINSTALPMLNKSAALYLYNLAFTNPRILRNNEVCSSEICSILSYSAGNLIFNVTMFSSYSAEETPSATSTSESSGSGGGSAARIKKCNEIWVCEDWGACKNGLEERNCNAIAYCDGSLKPATSRACAIKIEQKTEAAEKTETKETPQYKSAIGAEKEKNETKPNLITGAVVAEVKETNPLVGMLILFTILALGIYLYFFSGIFFTKNN